MEQGSKQGMKVAREAWRTEAVEEVGKGDGRRGKEGRDEWKKDDEKKGGREES
jgi:hypothetical protein